MMSEKCGIICSVYFCKNYSWQKDARSFFRFPRNRERCAVWVSKCKREDLEQIFKIQSAEYLNKNNRICSDHFQLSDFNNPNLKSQGLKKTAIPTLNLTAPSSENLGQNTVKNQQKLRKRRIRLCVREVADSSMSDKKDDSPLSSAVSVNSLLPEFLMESRNSSVRCKKDAEIDSKTVIKEEPRLMQEELTEIKSELNGSPFVNCDVKNEIVPFESHFIAENIIHNDNQEAVIKVEIKEEPSWTKSGSTEPKLESEEAPNLADDLQDEEKDSTSWMFGLYEDISQPESPRLHTEAVCNNDSDTPTLIIRTFEDKQCLKVTEVCDSKQDDTCKDHEKGTTKELHIVNSASCLTANKSEACEKNFSSLSELKQHTMSHEHKQLHKCEICDTSYTRMSSLKIHKLNHAGRKAYKCEICEKSFAQASALKKHNSIHEGKKHKCDICEHSFTQIWSLKVHKLNHEGKRPHKCKVCEKSFAQVSDLKRHNLIIHEGKKPHKCAICEKSYTRISSLNVHKSSHEGSRPYKCELCEKRFMFQFELEKHSLIHKGRNLYKCKVCDRSFTRASNLKGHTLIHEGIRPYRCEICKKSFTVMSNLKIHKMIHEGKRPYRYKVCNKGFTQVSHLKRHNLIHEGEKPYKCEICDKGFLQLSHLKKHGLIHEA